MKLEIKLKLEIIDPLDNSIIECGLCTAEHPKNTLFLLQSYYYDNNGGHYDIGKSKMICYPCLKLKEKE